MLIPVEIVSFAVDPARNMPLVILRQSGAERTIAIPVGQHEASVIAIKSLNVTPEKPMTIDLVKSVIESFGGALERVVITDYVNGSFLARLQIHAGCNIVALECSSSDAISLALRCESLLFVAELVFEKHNSASNLTPAQQLRRSIASIDTLSFGRYYLE